MKAVRNFCAVLSAVGLLALSSAGAGCSHSAVPGPSQAQARGLSSKDAAQLAASLANEECARLYKRRPFEASQHPALMQDGEYRWGGLDPGAPGGYSALVTFRRDGSHPKVEVYFSTDQLILR